MGTHPIFESDFDCLTLLDSNRMEEEEGEDYVEIEDENQTAPMESDSDYEETEEEKRAQFEDIQENATMIFDRHSDAVFCSKTSPNGELIASGGQDDRGFIFDRNGELHMALFGHKESVVSIDWNSDGTLLASGDMSGLVKVWNVRQKKSIAQFEEEEVEFIKFHPTFKQYLLVCQVDGNCYFYSIASSPSYRGPPQPQGQQGEDDPDHVRDLQHPRHVCRYPGCAFPVCLWPYHRYCARLW